MPSGAVVVVSTYTGAGMSALIQQTQAKLNQAQVKLNQSLFPNLPKTYTSFDDAMNKRFWESDAQDYNYVFGEAMYATKHPRAKEYHALTQRGKTRMRQQYEAKMNSTHPHTAKHKELAKLFAVMKVTAKLERP